MQSAERSGVACCARQAVPEQIIALAAFSVFLFALPAHAAAASLMWGNGGGTPTQVEILDGGTYTVPLNTEAPGYIAYQGMALGILYQVTDLGGTAVRGEPLATFYLPNPETDTQFAWPAAGTYELDISVMQISESYNDTLKRWLARALLADVAHAQFSEVVETLHFTIQEAVPACVTDCFSNVLFLPGIESSRLYRPDGTEDGNKIWEPALRGHDNSQLAMTADGTSVASDIYTKDALKSVLGVDIYGSFISTMSKFADEKGITFETFPYDWRYAADIVASNPVHLATTTITLVDEIKQLAARSKSKKVTLIAHSNGGLVAKEIMLRLGDDASQYVDKLIFVAVPQVGTPQAVVGLLHGYNQGIPVSWAPLLLTDAESRSLGQNMPGTYGLLPSAGYFTDVDTPAVTFAGDVPDWPERYGDIVHSQERLHIFLTDASRTQPAVNELRSPAVLSDSLLTQAEKMHQDIDEWTPPAGVQLIQIAGWGVPSTVSGVDYVRTFDFKKEEFTTVPQPRFTSDGDGTVVVPSALWTSTATGATSYWIDLNKYNAQHQLSSVFGILSFTHARILAIRELNNFISDLIINAVKPLDSYTYLSTSSPQGNDIRLVYALHSPLTLDLYDDQQNHTGVSTTTEQIEEQIPGTYFVQFGDVKYVFSDISSPQHIVMSGYDSGTFTFEFGEWQGDTSIASTTFRDVPVTPQTIVRFDVSSGFTSASNLSVDTDGDGTIDSSYASSTGQLIVVSVPQEVSVAPSSGGEGGGNGPLASTAAASTTLSSDVATSTTPAFVAATSTSIMGVEATTTQTIATSTPTKSVTVRKPSLRPPQEPSSPVVNSVPQAQVAAAAQVTGGNLWPLVRWWIMSTIYSLLRI